MMKKMRKERIFLKKNTLPPSVIIDFIEMEYGIAANSVITAPQEKTEMSRPNGKTKMTRLYIYSVPQIETQ
jgi:hypothetical protein